MASFVYQKVIEALVAAGVIKVSQFTPEIVIGGDGGGVIKTSQFAIENVVGGDGAGVITISQLTIELVRPLNEQLNRAYGTIVG